LVLLESISLYFGLEGSLHYFENDKSAIEAFKLHCLTKQCTENYDTQI
jgi:hypothetical protein